MKFIVVGCGRQGIELACLLQTRGHQVAVIDSNPDAFDRLTPAFGGKKIAGVGFDRDVLLKARIQETDGVAAVTSNDNANILIALLARKTFQVPQVVARIYDPHQATIYNRLGIQTISPVQLSSHAFADLLTFVHLTPAYLMGNGEVQLVHLPVPPHLIGKQVSLLNRSCEIQVVSVVHQNQAYIPEPGSVLYAEDSLYMVVSASGASVLSEWLGG